MSDHVEVRKTALYDGTNSADIINLLTEFGAGGPVDWVVASETDGVCHLEGLSDGYAACSLTLNTGDSAAVYFDTYGGSYAVRVVPAAMSNGFAGLVSRAEFDALAATVADLATRVTALETP